MGGASAPFTPRRHEMTTDREEQSTIVKALQTYLRRRILQIAAANVSADRGERDSFTAGYMQAIEDLGEIVYE